MNIQSLKQRIHSTQDELKSEEEQIEREYKNIWHSGMSTFDILQKLEWIRNKQVELETTLKIIEEYV